MDHVDYERRRDLEAGFEDARRAAGHAEHFLSRLDRVSARDAELALSLYNDVPLLAEILRRARVPGSAPRVAIALKDGGRGPHIIVTRDAKFVTCLGEGMSVGGLPVVMREQLTAFSASIDSLRKKLVAAVVTGTRQPTRRLFERPLNAGPALTREEFMAAAAWVPLFRGQVFNVLAKMLKLHGDLYGRYRKERKITPANEAGLKALWSNMWAIGHFLAFCAGDAQEICAEIADIGGTIEDIVKIPERMVRQVASIGPFGITLRAVSFAANAGKCMVPHFKHLLRHGVLPHQVVTPFAVLLGIAHHHPRLATDIRAALRPSMQDHPVLSRLTEDLRGPARDVLVDAFERCNQSVAPMFARPELARARTWLRGSSIAMKLAKRSRKKAIVQFPSWADVPFDVALPLLVNGSAHNLVTPNALLEAVPVVASLDPEQLYLPAKYTAHLKELSNPTLVLEHLAVMRKYFPLRPIRRKEPYVGRNEVCSCGSGKKHKRCCAA
ncbi:MAG: SEC-C metal-binding domain-containing protein [Polyangiaceae bacterium]